MRARSLTDEANRRAAKVKLRILSEGIRIDTSCIDVFENRKDLMERRRAYNDTRDRSLDRNLRIPQEIFIGKVVVAVNHKTASSLSLKHDGTDFVISDEGGSSIQCDIPRRPTFLNLVLSDGTPLASLVNLYGGSSLAFFSPATCYYFNEGIQCNYCSLKPNRDLDSDFVGMVHPKQAAECLQVCLTADENQINQIMLVGGNTRDYNKGFRNYLEIVKALDIAIKKSDYPALNVHVAAMPPLDFTLIDELKGLNCKITFNLEVFDDALFHLHCEGKSKNYGRGRLKDALRYAVNALPGRVHSILIAGLESAESTCSGIDWLVEAGINPIVNIFHNDVGAKYESWPRPSLQNLETIAYHLQKVHAAKSIIPYWNGCGRNAIDFEAKMGWFT